MQAQKLTNAVAIFLAAGIFGLVLATVGGWPTLSIQARTVAVPLTIGSVLGLVFVYAIIVLSGSEVKPTT